MRRLLLLVAAALAALASGPLRRRNPWLSACDLEPHPFGAEAPALALCSASRADREKGLAGHHLPHCKERDIGSALDEKATRDALDGGIACRKVLRDLLHVDALAERASQDLAGILMRYDCGQPFSVIHSCQNCQEAYRRWVCSSLLPLFVPSGAVEAGPRWRGARTGGAADPSPRPLPPAPPPLKKRSTSKDNYKRYATNNKNTKLKLNNNNLNYNNDYELLIENDENKDLFAESYFSDDDLSYGAGNFSLYEFAPSSGPASEIRARFSSGNGSALSFGEGFVTGRPSNEKGDGRPEHKVVETKKDLDNRLGRRRRGLGPDGEAHERLRIKPCLSVCQEVEQTCPYFLPGDRAPSYPTQYAGEPTFLCLDPNIEETGEQLLKSNYGEPECCYTYCKKELCPHCSIRPKREQPHSAPCGAQAAIPTSGGRRVSPALRLLLLASLLPFLVERARAPVGGAPSPRSDAPLLTLIDTVYYYYYYCIMRIMRIVPCARL